MFIKFFVESKDESEAMKLVEDSLNEIEENIKKKEFKSITSYWKMENTYIVEMIIELSQEALHGFLYSYSDKWLEFGFPVDELVASLNNHECTYMKNGFVLINIFL